MACVFALLLLLQDQAPDVVYRYTASASVDVTISTCGSGYDTKLIVSTNLTDTASYLCNDDDRNCASNTACSRLDVSFKVTCPQTGHMLIRQALSLHCSKLLVLFAWGPLLACKATLCPWPVASSCAQAPQHPATPATVQGTTGAGMLHVVAFYHMPLSGLAFCFHMPVVHCIS